MRKSSVYLTDRMKAALTARAGRTGRSEAQLIREAIDAALQVPPAPTAAGADPPVPGRLVGVGVGPGEADLLTVRAVTALRRADRILAPSTAVDAVGRAEAIVREAVPGVRVERVAFSMAPGRAARDRSVGQAAALVASHLDSGEEIAWITLGDPLTYSTFAAVSERVKRRRPGTFVVCVPGIMAYQALASRTGTIIAEDRGRVAICTALGPEDLTCDLADPTTTLVVYKGGRHLPELSAQAAAAGRETDAVAGELIGMPGERIGALRELAAGGPASYLATVIVPAARGHGRVTTPPVTETGA